MNSLISLLSSFIILFSSPADIPYTSLDKAMESNDAKSIVGYSKEKVLLNLLGKEGAYNHSQAELILDEFFDKKPKGTFTFIFKGKETSDGTFAVGTYTVKN